MNLYRYRNRDYFRTTGVLSSKECQAVGYNIKNKVKKDLVTNAITIPGTLMHWKNEKFLREVKDLAPPEPTHWSKGAQEILDQWTKDGEIQERLIMPANQGFDGFMMFWKKYHHINEEGIEVPSIDPVLIEHTMYVDNFANTGMAVAGTADLIARVWLKGEIEEDGYFHECKHHIPYDPLCKCTHMWVVTLMDWKFSIRKQPSHPEQLSAYHYKAMVTGAFDIVSEDGKFPINHENWSLLFKRPNNVVGFTLNRYSQDIKPFLSALKIMEDPKFTSLNSRNYTFGLKGRCLFCSYQNNCPDRRTNDQDQTVYVLEENSEKI